MSNVTPPSRPRLADRWPATARVIRIIIVEALTVALVGFFVWGVAWEIGYPAYGLIAAVIIWLSVSPAIEIWTLLGLRQSSRSDSGDDAGSTG